MLGVGSLDQRQALLPNSALKGPRPGLASPASIAGLAAWLDANAPGTVITDGAQQFTLAQSQFLQLATGSEPFSAQNAQLSFAGWFRVDAINTGSNQVLMGRAGSSGDTTWDWAVQVSAASSRVQTQVRKAGAQVSCDTGNNSVAAATWYFVAGTIDTTGGQIALKLWLGSGATLGSPTTASDASPQTTCTSAPKFTLGARDNAAGLYFGGTMDSVAVWRGRLLSQSDAEYLFNGGVGRIYSDLSSGMKASLSAWYDLDELTGNCQDSHGSYHLARFSGNAIDASANNGGFETAGGGGADVFASWGEAVGGTNTISRDTANQDSGSACLALGANDGSASCYVSQVVLIPGQTYSFSVRAKSSDGSGSINVGNTSGAATLSLTGSYQTFTGSFVATTTAFIVGRNTVAPGRVYYVDGVTLTAQGPAPATGIVAGLATDGDPVKSWSGVGVTGTQTTHASKPTYRANQINGLSCVRFDGVDDNLDLTGAILSATNNVGGATLFAVVRNTTVATGSVVFLSTGGGSGTTRILMQRTASGESHSGRRLDADSAQNVNTPTQAYLAGTAYAVSHIIDYANTSVRIRQNGVLGPNTSSYQTAGNTSATDSLAGKLGSSSASLFYGGDIAELIIYNRALSATEVAQVERYLATKYALAVAG